MLKLTDEQKEELLILTSGLPDDKKSMTALCEAASGDPANIQNLRKLIELKYPISDIDSYQLLLTLLTLKEPGVTKQMLSGLGYLSMNLKIEKPNLLNFLTFLNLCAELRMNGTNTYLTCGTMLSAPKTYPLPNVITFFTNTRDTLTKLKSPVCFTDKLIKCMPLTNAIDNAIKSLPTELTGLIVSYILSEANYRSENVRTRLESDVSAPSYKPG